MINISWYLNQACMLEWGRQSCYHKQTDRQAHTVVVGGNALFFSGSGGMTSCSTTSPPKGLATGAASDLAILIFRPALLIRSWQTHIQENIIYAVFRVLQAFNTPLDLLYSKAEPILDIKRMQDVCGGWGRCKWIMQLDSVNVMERRRGQRRSKISVDQWRYTCKGSTSKEQ